MYKIIIIILFVIGAAVLSAENPSSANYILQQESFGSGNNPANLPISSNYILEGSISDVISGDEASSSNYNILPGYYFGEISGGILPPTNVTIAVVGSAVQISWSAVSDATSYQVYSSTDPYTGFDEDTTGTFVDESWSAPASADKMFYYVKAVN